VLAVIDTFEPELAIRDIGLPTSAATSCSARFGRGFPPPRRHLVRYAGVLGQASQRPAQLRVLVPARGGEPPYGHRYR